MTPETTIQQLITHPAFGDFGPRLLSHDRDAARVDMPLRDIGSTMPYHSHVDPEAVVEGLNRLVDDADAGRPIFYDIYSERKKREDRRKASTGLFFFRGRPDAPFAVICPGGGFAYVASLHEGFPYAVALSNAGFNAFVLRYRVGDGGVSAMEDLAVALSFVFTHADTLGVGTKDYSLWGSSAGARMAAGIGSFGTGRFGGKELPKPAVVVMAYTGQSSFTPDDPPTFAVVGADDGIAPAAVVERRMKALHAAGVDVEFRRYDGVGHGFGLGQGTPAEGWIDHAMRFWRKHIDP